jgi:hypothetical protein
MFVRARRKYGAIIFSEAFLTKLEPLRESSWLYYEEDFNEFRRRYQANS